MNTESDRELLELAAKAAGIDYHIDHLDGIPKMVSDGHVWNPLVWDGQALRLAVACGLVVDASRPSAGEPFKLHHFGQDDAADPYAATRRAITQAAASIGRGEG